MPTSLAAARLARWHVTYYAPHLLRSKLSAQTPDVRGFGTARQSDLVERLRQVNALAPTKMSRVMTRHGSDKGRGWHNYTTVYSALYAGRTPPARIFELGLGTNNVAVLSNMGSEGRPGASLRGWKELFPDALVFGADIDKTCLFEEPGIKTFYCDQLDQTSIRELWAQPDLQQAMDLLVEDGLHTFDANLSFLDGSLEHITPGGLYIIEDIAINQADRWYDVLETVYAKRFPAYEFAFVALPNSLNSGDNNMLVVQRPSH